MILVHVIIVTVSEVSFLVTRVSFVISACDILTFCLTVFKKVAVKKLDVLAFGNVGNSAAENVCEIDDVVESVFEILN